MTSVLGLWGHVRCPLMSILKCRLLQFARGMRTMRTLRTSQTKHFFFTGCEPNELCELTEQNYFLQFSSPLPFSFLCEIKCFFTGSLGSQSSQCRVQWICWCSCQLSELVTTNSYRTLRTKRTMRTGKQKLFLHAVQQKTGKIVHLLKKMPVYGTIEGSLRHQFLYISTGRSSANMFFPNK